MPQRAHCARTLTAFVCTRADGVALHGEQATSDAASGMTWSPGIRVRSGKTMAWSLAIWVRSVTAVVSFHETLVGSGFSVRIVVFSTDLRSYIQDEPIRRNTLLEFCAASAAPSARRALFRRNARTRCRVRGRPRRRLRCATSPATVRQEGVSPRKSRDRRAGPLPRETPPLIVHARATRRGVAAANRPSMRPRRGVLRRATGHRRPPAGGVLRRATGHRRPSLPAPPGRVLRRATHPRFGGVARRNRQRLSQPVARSQRPLAPRSKARWEGVAGNGQ